LAEKKKGEKGGGVRGQKRGDGMNEAERDLCVGVGEKNGSPMQKKKKAGEEAGGGGETTLQKSLGGGVPRWERVPRMLPGEKRAVLKKERGGNGKKVHGDYLTHQWEKNWEEGGKRMV